MDLSKLTNKRREHIQSCRDNNDNSHKIIAGLYSDPSHFIYELLQNADDAGASEVIFNLTSKSLTVRHNGKKLFDFNDVDSITTVGSSTKKDDVNSIGTFGAGFKSVFAITKTPSIHSGVYHFKIIDFIVPEIVEPLNIEDQYTVICLPFNHPDISLKDAYKQIANRLQKLESESLLFLRNIQEIQWSTELDKGHYLSEIKGDKASLISQVNEQDNLKVYYIFRKDIEIDRAKLNIVVAYQLDTDDDCNTIIPVHDSKLFVFFPTNERTGLKFLVHAPYKTTPSRETIPFDDNQNQIITNELSILIAESIQSIKNNGLLNVAFLTMLPIDSENKHPLYSLAFQKVRDTLATSSLLPTSDGGYINAKNTLLAREKELTTLLNSSDCSELFERERWISSAITYDKTRELRDYFTEVLYIPEITMQKFCSGITKEFIESKQDGWVINFYSNITKNKSLYRIGAKYQKKGILRERPIIRLEDGSHICPENDLGELQVYLPSVGKSKFKTVKRTIIESGESLEFLRSLGLKEPSDLSEIKEFIIPKYQSNYIEKDEYIDDLKRVLTIWSKSDEYKKKEISDLLNACWFVRCKNQIGNISFQKLETTYVYFDRKILLDWFDGGDDKGVYFLDAGLELTKELKEFFKSLDVDDILKINTEDDELLKELSCKDSRYCERINNFNPFLTINGLKYAIENINVGRSIFLWQFLLNNNPNRLFGNTRRRTYLHEEFTISKRENSSILNLLENKNWLYDKQDHLIHSPEHEISIDDLHNDYKKEHDNIDKLIKALGLKLDKVKQFEEENPDLVIIPRDEHDAFKKWEADMKNEDVKEDNWEPEIDPEDAILIEDESSFKKHRQEDLSGQDTKGNSESDDANNNNEENKNNISPKPKDSKAIGDWGESIANRYLIKKYPNNEVIWLNKHGNTGKGFDFLIKENGEEIAYYEVKSKIDEAPKLFEMSGMQWSWAKKLHKSRRGGMYKILLVSNAGKNKTKIREIIDPVKLWNAGELFADPVNIEL